MADKPASYQLSIYISTMFIIVLGIFIYWSYYYSSSLIEKNVQANAELLSKQIICSVEEKIFVTEEVCQYMAWHMPLINSGFNYQELLQSTMLRYEYIHSIHLNIHGGQEENPFALMIAERNNEDILYRTVQDSVTFLEEYQELGPQVLSGMEPTWSKAYKCLPDSQLVVLYYYPFILSPDSSGLRRTGYVACELSLGFLNILIDNTRVGEKGYAFLIDRDGKFITHPLHSLIMNRSLLSLPDEIYKGTRDKLEALLSDGVSPLVVYPDILNHKRSLAFHARIPQTGWILALVRPYSEINQELRWNLIKMIVISLFVAALIFYAVFSISDRVMKPLSSVTHEIQTFSHDQDEYNHYVRNEAEALSNSLKRLRKMYERFRLNEEESNKNNQLMQQDLLQAYEIQKSIIPPAGLWVLDSAGISVYSVFRPSKVVSGDLYDFFMTDNKHLLVTVGDVSGAGVPAAFFMSVAHTFIKSYARSKKPKKIISQVNKELCRNNQHQFFITLFLGILDIETGHLVCCNAGHTPSFLIRSGGRVEILHEVHGLPLGLYPERSYHESSINLEPGDKLVFYTDGVTDQVNEAGNTFGMSNLKHYFLQSRHESPQDIADGLMRTLKSFAGGAPESDDISLLVLQFSGSQDIKATT